jgi:iron-sulfur cluster assembly accessory protein
LRVTSDTPVPGSQIVSQRSRIVETKNDDDEFIHNGDSYVKIECLYDTNTDLLHAPDLTLVTLTMNTGKMLRLVSTVSRKNALTSRNMSVAVAVKVPGTRETPLKLHTSLSTSNSRRTMVMVTKTKKDEIPLVVPQETGESSAPVGAAAPEAASIEPNSAGVLVTNSCFKQIRNLASKKQKPLDELYLRVFVDSGGCSGFSYAFEISDEALESDDVVFSEPGEDGQVARVVVDESSLEYIRGSSIDYVQEMIKSSFTVKDNPLSESACGCGSSFAVKNFSSNPALD